MLLLLLTVCGVFSSGQWFTMKRQHAIIVMADGLYYSRFREYCGVSLSCSCSWLVLFFSSLQFWLWRENLYEFQPGIEADKNCIADEHYLPTFFSVRIFFLTSLPHLFAIFQAFLMLKRFLYLVDLLLLLSDAWSHGDLQLVSNVCWLVWTKVASKDVHSKWDIISVHEKCHGNVLKRNLFEN